MELDPERKDPPLGRNTPQRSLAMLADERRLLVIPLAVSPGRGVSRRTFLHLPFHPKLQMNLHGCHIVVTALVSCSRIGFQHLDSSAC